MHTTQLTAILTDDGSIAPRKGLHPHAFTCIGLARTVYIYTPYMTVYIVISLPKNTVCIYTYTV